MCRIQARNGVLALPLHALLRVAQRSTHAPRTSDTLLMRHDVLRHVGRSM
jgi:hypothetical protein